MRVRLSFTAYINKYLTQESRSSALSEVIDCKGGYGTQCGNPLPKCGGCRARRGQGTFEAALYWTRLIDQDRTTQSATTRRWRSDVFPAFQRIDAFDYFDLNPRWSPTDYMTVRLSVANLLEEDPPVVGNEAADTRSNSGNTFPSVYEILGRTYTLGVHIRF